MERWEGTPRCPATARSGVGEAESWEVPPGLPHQLSDSVAVASRGQAARQRAGFPFLSHPDTGYPAAGSCLGKPCHPGGFRYLL